MSPTIDMTKRKNSVLLCATLWLKSMYPNMIIFYKTKKIFFERKNYTK